MRPPAEYLAGRIEAGDIPSASWLIGTPEEILLEGSAGHAVLAPEKAPAGNDTIYDLASLTKPLITSPLALLLSRESGFSLTDRAGRFLPEMDRLDKREITLFHLLTHASGLPDWAPLYLGGESVREYVAQIGRMEPLERPGRKILYSDLGYILLGAILEQAGSAPLESLARAFLLEPAGAEALFRPGERLLARVAATEESCNYERRMAGPAAAGYSRWRSGVIRGEVHDQNAWAAGGVSGHAGLFGTARDVWLVARESMAGESSLLRPEEQDLLREIQTGSLPEPRSAAYRVNRGQDGASDPETAAGASLPPEAYGHNGFTGTSVWMDPGTDRVYVLLTNRVHPTVREEIEMNVIRREFHRHAAGV